MKTGKITFIQADGTFESYGNTLSKYKVTLATGEVFTFNAKGDFKKNVGDEIEFEVTNEQYGNAKLIYNKPFQAAPQYNQATTPQKKDDVQKFIIRQSSVASSVNFWKDKGGSEQQVLDFAEKIVNYIYS